MPGLGFLNEQQLSDLLAGGGGGGGGSGIVTWGSMTGPLSDQADLQFALDAKQSTSGLPEAAQDAIGAMVDASLVYVDGTPLLTRAALTGDATAAQGSNALTVVKINGVSMAGLGTGILKNTTGTGAPSIAVAADFPTLNQNTTGSAATLTTSRNFSISGGGITAAAVGFNGSAVVVLSASVDAGHITLARMANLAANSFIGNNTGSAATPIALTISQAKTLLAIANTDVSGLGTMSTQNASAVAITGGTAGGLTSVAIGRSAPLTGVFTAKTATNENFSIQGHNTLADGTAISSLTDGGIAAGLELFASTVKLATSVGLVVAGSFSVAIRTITATATLAANDYTVLVDATTGAVTVNLPAASGCPGRIYNIKKIDATANTVTIDPNSTELIDGVATKATSTSMFSWTIQSNGTAWYIL